MSFARTFGRRQPLHPPARAGLAPAIAGGPGSLPGRHHPPAVPPQGGKGAIAPHKHHGPGLGDPGTLMNPTDSCLVHGGVAQTQTRADGGTEWVCQDGYTCTQSSTMSGCVAGGDPTKPLYDTSYYTTPTADMQTACNGSVVFARTPTDYTFEFWCGDGKHCAGGAEMNTTCDTSTPLPGSPTGFSATPAPGSPCLSGNAVGVYNASGQCIQAAQNPGDDCTTSDGCAGLVGGDSVTCVKKDAKCGSVAPVLPHPALTAPLLSPTSSQTPPPSTSMLSSIPTWAYFVGGAAVIIGGAYAFRPKKRAA